MKQSLVDKHLEKDLIDLLVKIKLSMGRYELYYLNNSPPFNITSTVVRPSFCDKWIWQEYSKKGAIFINEYSPEGSMYGKVHAILPYKYRKMTKEKLFEMLWPGINKDRLSRYTRLRSQLWIDDNYSPFGFEHEE